MNLSVVFLLLFAVRLASVFIVQTFYVPDEYWQSLEVAHKFAFGYGYLTWEWVQGIRSYIYPLIFAGLYKLLAIWNLDQVQLLVLLPRILQATLTAYSDYRFYIWSGGKKWALFLITVPWFWFYTGSRTLSNTLEASLTTIALSYFPWQGKERFGYLWLVSLCCFIRPTALLIWIPIIVYHIRRSRYTVFGFFLMRFIIMAAIVVGLCVGIDTWAHGELLITPFEFFKYNILHNISSFYGSQPWYWYITVGLPTVLGINTLPFIIGTVETVRHRKVFPIRLNLLIAISISLCVLSFVEHKEFRFVAPLLPLCLYICVDTMARWSYKASNLALWIAAIVIVLGNALPAWYLSTVHQRGPIELMPHLQDIARNYRDENNNTASIHFLMPCHSTPYYSHIHANITLRFLTCEPNLKNVPNYKDEADKFYEAPMQWLRSHIPAHPRTATPTHVVLFETLEPKINAFLTSYKNILKIENTEHMQARTGKSILVYQRLRAGEENAYNRQQEQQNLGDDPYDGFQPGEIREDVVEAAAEAAAKLKAKNINAFN